VRLDGARIDGLPPDAVVRRGLALVPERRELFPSLSVAENLALGAFARRNRGGVAADLEMVLALFPRLRERLGQAARTLSGGEQQMLAIARGLMSRPRYLLLDEPSLGLAPMLIEEIFRKLVEIRAHGTAILLVEQNAAAALEVADHGYVLETGVIRLEGSATALAADDAVREAYLR
jgi:branched-chain amino acid transport system ATP-binding protein